MEEINDPILNSIVRVLRNKHKCHTIVLYGSRARGLTTPTSDYDVFGVRRLGGKTRIAKKQNGGYWDVFVYSEKDLLKFDDQHFSWKNARLIYHENSYGPKLLRRIQSHVKKPYKRQPRSEIAVIKAWAQKELERCRMKDIQGLFRRSEFLAALIEHYFFVRQKRYWGPKESFAWVKKNDPQTFTMIERALKFPTSLTHLRAAASRVYKIALI